jgi:hypothetical protein
MIYSIYLVIIIFREAKVTLRRRKYTFEYRHERRRNGWRPQARLQTQEVSHPVHTTGRGRASGASAARGGDGANYWCRACACSRQTSPLPVGTWQARAAAAVLSSDLRESSPGLLAAAAACWSLASCAPALLRIRSLDGVPRPPFMSPCLPARVTLSRAAPPVSSTTCCCGGFESRPLLLGWLHAHSAAAAFQFHAGPGSPPWSTAPVSQAAAAARFPPIELNSGFHFIENKY